MLLTNYGRWMCFVEFFATKVANNKFVTLSHPHRKRAAFVSKLVHNGCVRRYNSLANLVAKSGEFSPVRFYLCAFPRRAERRARTAVSLTLYTRETRYMSHNRPHTAHSLRIYRNRAVGKEYELSKDLRGN